MLAIVFRLILLGIHLYVWYRLVYQARLPRRWYIGLTALIIFLFLAGPLTTASRNIWPGISSTFGWISLPWMALCGLTFLALVVIDVGRLGIFTGKKLASRPTALSPDRRAFLARITGGTAMAVGTASVARGMISARGEHEIADVEVKLAKLPKALDGFTIVQLSDLHIGMTIDRGFVQRVVERANALSPDLLVLTGDLVDGRVDDLAEEARPLADLRAKHGVYAITGNHEYYSGADEWIAELSEHGIKYLRNRRVVIADGFTLAGVDDFSAKDYPGHGADYQAALAGRDADKPVILLAHQPRQVRRAAEHGVDFQLSGHTHGGQIWPWHYLVRLQQGGFLSGRYTWKGTELYVSRGCGYWGPPVRLLAPLEITRLTLRAA